MNGYDHIFDSSYEYNSLYSDEEYNTEVVSPQVANTEVVNTEVVNLEVATNYSDKKQYSCVCDPNHKFARLDQLRRHMKKHHNVLIPNKFKRKAAEVQDDSTLKEKDFKQWVLH